MKRFFKCLLLFQVLICTGHLTSSAQNSAYDVVRQIFEVANPGLDISSMSSAIQSYTTLLFENSDVDVDEQTISAIVETYCEGRLEDDFISIMADFFAEQMSLDELEIVKLLYTSDSGRSAFLHSSAVNDDSEIEEMTSLLTNGLLKIMAGHDAVIPVFDVPEYRRELLEDYIECSGVGRMFDNYVKMLFDGEDFEEDDYNKMTEFTSGLIDEYLIHISVKYQTDDDLRYYQVLSRSEEYKKFVSALDSIISDPLRIGNSILGLYNSWLLSICNAIL